MALAEDCEFIPELFCQNSPLIPKNANSNISAKKIAESTAVTFILILDLDALLGIKSP